MAVVTIGKFDGFHLGHRLLLEKLKELSGDHDEAVVLRILTPGKKLLSHDEMTEILSGYGDPKMRELDFTPEFAGITAGEFVRDILVKSFSVSEVIVGKDFRFGKDRTGDVDMLTGLGREYGFGVTAVDKLSLEGAVVSSSRIRSCLSEGDVKTAGRLLGQDIAYSGIVQHGKQLGRTIGFPTINLFAPEDKLLPRFGVYRSITVMDGIKYSGLTNIGLRPTVEESTTATVETFLKGYSGDAYGHNARVILVDFLRPEKHFSSVDDLVDSMKKDLKYI